MPCWVEGVEELRELIVLCSERLAVGRDELDDGRSLIDQDKNYIKAKEVHSEKI